jgi:hypothetical protein
MQTYMYCLSNLSYISYHLLWHLFFSPSWICQNQVFPLTGLLPCCIFTVYLKNPRFRAHLVRLLPFSHLVCLRHVARQSKVSSNGSACFLCCWLLLCYVKALTQTMRKWNKLKTQRVVNESSNSFILQCPPYKCRSASFYRETRDFLHSEIGLVWKG